MWLQKPIQIIVDLTRQKVGQVEEFECLSGWSTHIYDSQAVGMKSDGIGVVALVHELMQRT